MFNKIMSVYGEEFLQKYIAVEKAAIMLYLEKNSNNKLEDCEILAVAAINEMATSCCCETEAVQKVLARAEDLLKLERAFI